MDGAEDEGQASGAIQHIVTGRHRFRPGRLSSLIMNGTFALPGKGLCDTSMSWQKLLNIEYYYLE